MISTGFTFDGIHSSTPSLFLIRTGGSSGLFPRPYVTSCNINEDYPNDAFSPYFFNVQHQPPTFTLSFSTLSNNMNSQKLKSLASWLFQDTYKSFISDDDPYKTYYLISTGEVNFETNGNNEGYFTVQFRSKFPYALMPESTTTYNSSPFTIDNESNISEYYLPEFEFTATSSTFQLTNTSDGSRVTQITGLDVGEVVNVDGRKTRIISSVEPRFDTFNNNWLRLKQGENTLSFSGTDSITFKTIFPIFG